MNRCGSVQGVRYYKFIPARAEAPPKPTVLYSLGPEGLGTPFSESLSSYLTRLAAAHMVSPTVLLREVIGRSDGNEDGGRALGPQGVVRKMDGMGREASKVTRALEKLTGRSELHLLTMQSYLGLIAKYNLLSENRAWCPYCLEQQRASGKTVYYPLLWGLSYLEKCPIHRNKLFRVCPFCRTRMPTFSSTAVVGYCDRCTAWLGCGTQRRARATHSSDQHFFVRLLKWRATGDLTRRQPTFPAMLDYLVGKKLKKTYQPGLNRQMYLKKEIIDKLRYGEMLPTIGIVLWLAKMFRTDPFDVLTMTAEEMQRKDAEVCSSVAPALFKPEKINWQQLHGLLRDVASGRASLMRIEDIARVYKCTPETIISSCPEFCDQISNRIRLVIKASEKPSDLS